MNNLNPVTILALLAWPLVAVLLYKTRPLTQATLWTILGAYMLLPVDADIKIPMIPVLDKSSIPNLAALFGCMVICGRSIRFSKGFGLAELLVVTLMICPFITNELNNDPIPIGTLVLPGLGGYDAGSAVIAQAITLIPFFLGRQLLCNSTDTEEILRVLVIGGLIYSLFSIVEILFSPQLHIWIYGYYPGAGAWFAEQMRRGGFRPAVFMGHGLLVSFFICTTAVAAAAFWRTNTQVTRMVRLPASGIVAYLSLVLVLCKTVSSTIYGAILIPLVYFTKPKLQLSIAVLLVSMALLYPMLRFAGLVPTGAAVDLAATAINSERSESLEIRFDNEDALLQRASQRFLFGWGRYGRSNIYNEEGERTDATDGTWIITLGEFGLIGFLAEFGLLALPVFAAAFALRFAASARDKVFISALALILAINIFDLLPNSPLRPWTWLVAGALLGRAEALRRWARLPTAVRMALAASPSRPSNGQGSRSPSAFT
jgi:hypothetical protein